MARRNKHKAEMAGSGAERWLLTYADMITLLLALFILLFAMSTIDPKKFEILRVVLSDEFQAFAVNDGNTAPINGSTDPLSSAEPAYIKQTLQAAQIKAETNEREQKDVNEVLRREVDARIKSVVGSTKLAQQIQTISSERGLIIRLKGDTFFESGSAEINPEAVAVLRELGRVLAADGHNVAIEGHTDGVPINSGQYSDNWELSGARANTVLQLMLSAGMSGQRLRYTGFAATEPAKEPDYAKQPVAANRRVEIVVLTSIAAAEAGYDVPAGGGSDMPVPPAQQQPDVIGDVINISMGM